MKQLIEMNDKEFDDYLKTVKPIIPIWAKPNTVITERRIDSFVDKAGNSAKMCTVVWKDKKGEHETVHWIRWD